MATNEAWIPSRRMQAAAVAERTRLERELERLESQRARLANQLAAIDAARENLRDEMRVLHRFASDGLSPERPRVPRLRPVDGASAADETLVLKGAQIRETAVRLLASSPNARAPVHYRVWYELLRREGFVPAGRDPLATFLTQIGRSPAVVRTSAPGTYQLDFEAPARARERLASLRAALKTTHELGIDASVDEIAKARRRRAEVAADLEATEKQLAEATRSLGGCT